MGLKKFSQSLRVFLCHSHGDKQSVRSLYEKLLTEGIDPWLDEENLLPGQDWEREIKKAVGNNDVVIVCLSKVSINKAGFVQKEIKFALDEADKQPEGTIFIIPLKLEECDIPERLSRWHWVNLFEERGYERLMQALKVRAVELKKKIGNVQKHSIVITEFRYNPKEGLDYRSVKDMLKRHGFYCGEYAWTKEYRNSHGSGFQNKFEEQKEAKVICDHASGLIWQQSSFNEEMTYDEVDTYVALLNRDQFAGYDEWRLPTLEEAMSLMKPNMNNDGLYIDPVFGKHKVSIWTSDTYNDSRAWVVDFYYGVCYNFFFNHDYSVRAVC